MRRSIRLTALKLLWRLPFWKGWGLTRLICCWITLGEFWLTWSQRGHTAALSGDGGLEQMGWLNQGESAGLDVHLYVSVIPERALMFAWLWPRGRFMYQCCVCPTALPLFLNIGRDPCLKDSLNQASLTNRHDERWPITGRSADGVTLTWSFEQMSLFQSF